MTACAYIVLGVTTFIFTRCRAIPVDMCDNFVSQRALSDFTFYNDPGNDGCCCSLRFTQPNMNFSMSSNVTYFLLVPVEKSIKNLQNATNLGLTNNTKVCATPDSGTTGVVNILGDAVFNVRCMSESILSTSTVKLTPETDNSTDSETLKSTEITATTTAAAATTTTEITTPVPSTLTLTGCTKQEVTNGSTETIPFKEEDNGTNTQVFWIIGGSLAGLTIITGILVCLCVSRSQSKNRNQSPGNPRREISTAFNITYDQEDYANRAYRLASAQSCKGTISSVAESRPNEHEEDNELVVSENSLYSHELEKKSDKPTDGDTNIVSSTKL